MKHKEDKLKKYLDLNVSMLLCCLDSNEFQDPQRRVDFVKNMYNFLTLEFFITSLIIALGMETGVMGWLGYEFEECHNYNENDWECIIYIWLSPLFYVSLAISILLQFSLYFVVNTLRKDPFPYTILILQLFFYGFLVTTICIIARFNIGRASILISMGIIFLAIISQTFYLNLNIRDVSFIICAIIIAGITILMLIILPFVRDIGFLKCFLCSLLLKISLDNIIVIQ
ncbi:unnamed protein product [Paramecium primaurelia]|uniref:Uncharacterized protein n=1 Tax=Paramecium primaurelia TaxID=5886 RepID=A0A8S1MXS6_PARPR|nr:unnamed protein product [Paramecium primaurelia]